METYEQLVGLPKHVVDFGLPFTYFIFAVALLSAVAFPAIQLFQDVKKAITALVGVVGLALVYLLCYLLAKSEPLILAEETITAETMKFVEANLFMTYITFSIAVIAILYSSVSKYFK